MGITEASMVLGGVLRAWTDAQQARESQRQAAAHAWLRAEEARESQRQAAAHAWLRAEEARVARLPRAERPSRVPVTPARREAE